MYCLKCDKSCFKKENGSKRFKSTTLYGIKNDYNVRYKDSYNNDEELNNILNQVIIEGQVDKNSNSVVSEVLKLFCKKWCK